MLVHKCINMCEVYNRIFTLTFNTIASKRNFWRIVNNSFYIEDALNFTREFLYDNFNKKI